jgi:hypothetical protein
MMDTYPSMLLHSPDLILTPSPVLNLNRLFSPILPLSSSHPFLSPSSSPLLHLGAGRAVSAGLLREEDDLSTDRQDCEQRGPHSRRDPGEQWQRYSAVQCFARLTQRDIIYYMTWHLTPSIPSIPLPMPSHPLPSLLCPPVDDSTSVGQALSILCQDFQAQVAHRKYFYRSGKLVSRADAEILQLPLLHPLLIQYTTLPPHILITHRQSPPRHSSPSV